MTNAVVIGAGPAGLMAAQTLAEGGMQVTVCEAKPSVGRKFLMAGKSGLNLTKVEPEGTFLSAFAETEPRLAPIIQAFDADAVQDWARSMGQDVFTGSTGRVFPKVMKASPLLRAWMARLVALEVVVNTRWQWTGWQEHALRFETPEGEQLLDADVTILALGGASWSRLGSTGAWTDILAEKGVALAPFAPANAAVYVDWSDHMQRHFGNALKAVSWRAGPYQSRGEATLSHRGLEGGGIYSISRGVREGHDLTVDLLPDLTEAQVAERLSRPRGKASLTNHLRKSLKLPPAHIALAQEMARPLPRDPMVLARLLKTLPINHHGLRPMDEAISTAGGVRFDMLTEDLMLRDMPGVFVAGEMLDWEAPTGGYLITACLATGRWAGLHALKKGG
jgi:uncharacterized flavoprotein (TIGR03862 family)